MVELANNIENGRAVSDLFTSDAGLLKIDKEEWIREVINNEFHVDDSKMTREQDDNPGTYNSYGYRIVVQKIQFYGIGGYFNNGFAAPRKEVAENMLKNGNVYKAQGINGCVQLFGRQSGFSRELYTEQADVRISNGYSLGRQLDNSTWTARVGYDMNCSAGVAGSMIDDLADRNNGFGYNIIWFKNIFRNYDYTIDAACVGCDVSNSDNMAYYIQDTNDWDAIFASPDNTDNKNIRTYYDKGNGVFCREEYKVYFPNMNNQIDVGTGRYFTVNVSADDLLGVGHSTFPNFKPVKVVKVRECRVDPDVTDPVKSYDALRTFEEKSKSDFSTKFGKVSFRYY